MDVVEARKVSDHQHAGALGPEHDGPLRKTQRSPRLALLEEWQQSGV